MFTDLALFIQTLARRLNHWSVLEDIDQWSPGSPAYPKLQDVAYCWDGVAYAYGVLQFSASRVSVLNIRRMFHQTSLICNPQCYSHRYEYFATGVFLDVDPATTWFLFREMEIATRCVCSVEILCFKLLTHHPLLGNCVMVTSLPPAPWTHLSASHSETRLSIPFLYL